MEHAMSIRSILFTLCILSGVLLLCLSASPVIAQPTASPKPSKVENQDNFGGPNGVSGELEQNDPERESLYQFDTLQRALKPYFDWKRELNEKYGLNFGFNIYLLHQVASEHVGAPPENHGSGGIYRFQGSWTALGRGTGHPGKLEWRVEARSTIGGGLSPSQLGDAIAGGLNTGFGYSPNFDVDLAVLNWTQLFNKKTAGFAIGRLSFDAYLDAFAFQTFSRGFMNRAFLVNPTLATTGIGALGAVAKGMVTDTFWLGGQIYDGNAVSGDFDFDTVEEGEWLTGIEVGWTPSITRRKTDRIQLTYWHKDARAIAGVQDGYGFALSSSWQMTEQWLPFLRLGHSDGGAGVSAENAASIGFEYAVRKDQAWSLGAGWNEPSKKTNGAKLNDEYVLETSYKFQLSKNFSFTPDLQVVINPAKTPNESSIWVFGLRGIFTL